MTLRIGFHGGAGTVTGSKFLVHAAPGRVLIDCGQFQGLKELRLLNWQAPAFDPAKVDAVLLTHAHIDHSGYLPRLVREGYRGYIYTTPPTIQLARVLLMDAAKLQEEDAAFANRKGFSKHHPALPLFTAADARATLRRLRPVDYGEVLPLGGGITARFHNAGHILGSAMAELQVPDGRARRSIVFSGDVGRYDMPLHPDPAPPPACEALVMESTYGDRLHDPAPLLEQVRGPFRDTIVRGGTILVPAFAVARAQLVTLMLSRLMDSGDLPRVPVHIDSPMAVDVTEIYTRYLGSNDLDSDLTGGGRGLFPTHVQFHRSVGESRMLNELPGPRIIISSSGMLTGGRVLHHLHRLLPDPRNLVALVGYQAAGTRGRALLEGATTIRMHGEDVPVGAETVAIDGLSAHADRGELVRWVESGTGRPEMVFVTHGEPGAAAALSAALEGRGYRTLVPRLGDEFSRNDADGGWERVRRAQGSKGSFAR